MGQETPKAHPSSRSPRITALSGQEVRVLLLWSTTSTTSVISLLKSLARIGQGLEGRAGGFELPIVNGLFCQDMRVAYRRSSESLGSTRSLCSGCQEGRRRCSDAQVPCFKVMLGLHAGYSLEHFVPSSE